jgi:hypothetical protein
MFPLFLFIAMAGYLESRHWRRWHWWHRAYWLCIVMMAVVHVVLRAVLGG